MHIFKSLFILIARICLGAIFIMAGADKLMHPAETAAYMSAKGMTMVPFFLYAAALVELIGGLSLVLGYKTHWGAALLTLFLIAVTALFHNFWNVPTEMISFTKNVGIIGGLLYAVACGAGSLSIDALCCRWCGSKK